MNIQGQFPSQYIKAADLQGRTVKVVIDKVVTETVGQDTRPVLYFQGKERGMVLNRTNANTIASVYGNETDDWEGGELELFSSMVDFQGRSVEAIRCRVPPRKPNGNGNVKARIPSGPSYDGDDRRTHVPPADMNDDIPF